MVSSEEVQVIMVSLALQGHMNPMLKLAKVLVSKGVHVTLATNDVARKRMLDSNISTNFISKNSPGRLTLEFFSDGLSHEFDRDKDTGTFLASLKANGPTNVSNLITDLKANGNQFSCLITSPFIPWVPGVATEHGIPCGVLWIQSSTVFSIYYHCIKSPNLFPSLENPNGIAKLPGMQELTVGDLPTFMLPISPPHFRLWVTEFVSVLNKVKWVLGNSVHELEEETVNSLALVRPIYPIGPLVSPILLGKEETIEGSVDMWRAQDYCIEWLKKQESSSVIYISFGSIIMSSENQIHSIATALKNIKRPFLWVVKASNSRKDEFPSGFLEEIKKEKWGLVVSWCPQEKVLMNRAVACFVTHCGWNSTLETVVAGVPVVAYPEWTDQPTNSKLLVDFFKIGVRMRNCGEEGLNVEEVERCIMEVIDGPGAMEMKRRAMELKEAAKKALEDGGSSNRNFDRFISEITGKPYINNV
ncbi:UDP-glycosyltransferase 84B1 [Hibiscus syriacus]|uniref:Glycosyltransferase n=1 Tax=Hibiscus syriacus TaxID=106335 RepID=A0A6A2ZUY4_HIBSY|nr:UDP-glycosyltransferase 84B2-like [Hibiscus syriacus]KAE8695376.1 UDP-glycosyltransferase 84B1 [Hibiscus syriacus]